MGICASVPIFRATWGDRANLGLCPALDQLLTRIIHDSWHNNTSQAPNCVIGAVFRCFYARWTPHWGDPCHLRSPGHAHPSESRDRAPAERCRRPYAIVSIAWTGPLTSLMNNPGYESVGEGQTCVESFPRKHLLELTFWKEENAYKYKSGSSPCLFMSYSGLPLCASLRWRSVSPSSQISTPFWRVSLFCTSAEYSRQHVGLSCLPLKH
jgi:hypothetical protein